MRFSGLSAARLCKLCWFSYYINSALNLITITLPNTSGVFQGIFAWLITLRQPVMSQRGRKWLNLPSTASHSLWILRSEAEISPWTDNTDSFQKNLSRNIEQRGRQRSHNTVDFHIFYTKHSKPEYRNNNKSNFYKNKKKHHNSA